MPRTKKPPPEALADVPDPESPDAPESDIEQRWTERSEKATFSVDRRKFKGDPIKKRKKDIWLRALANSGNRTWAMRKTQTGYSYRRWINEDEYFAKMYYEALEEAADLIEAEAWRRAVDGYLEPVYQRGTQVGTVRRYSDRLLEILLRGTRPAKYGNKADINVTHKNADEIVEKETAAWIHDVLKDVDAATKP